jgi:MFS family permease
MFRFPLVLLFVALTFCCWGTYGPVLHEGQLAMGLSRWRPFICVGLAYFLIAVVVPLIIGRFHTESGRWTFRGVVWSLVAGAVGALGSLGIIMAFTLGGRPVYVMPLVFGCAPVVNTFVTMAMSKPGKRPGWIFYLGILMVALGGAGVLAFKPSPAQAHPVVESTEVVTAQVSDGAELAEEVSETAGDASEEGSDRPKPTMGFGKFVGTLATILMTICCWGSYGPLLHRGQARMDGSRMRPFICVGIAYFLVAIVIPLMILSQAPEQGNWTMDGGLWSLLAGALGAIGALGIIMAFNFGGRPVYVMPLVFGGAPVINTATSMFKSYINTGEWGSLGTNFLVSLGLVIAGAATVLVFAPKPEKPAPKVDDSSTSEDPAPVEEPASNEAVAAEPESTDSAGDEAAAS